MLFVFANMGPNGSENFKTLLPLNSQQKVFKLVNSPNGPHKTTFGIFEILSFRFLMNSFRKF